MKLEVEEVWSTGLIDTVHIVAREIETISILPISRAMRRCE